jgi:predicted metal-dependent phosphoesterase TrpH
MSDGRVLRADLHSHTYYSADSIASPQSFVDACRRRGIDCLAVTDHNSIGGALAVREIADFRVIVGEEIRTAGGEIMGLFLNDEVPKGLSARETVERIKEQGGLVGVPHPYDWGRYALRQEEMADLVDEIDFIEALNARIVFRSHNGKAADFAAEHGLAMSAGSDAHSGLEIGRAYVEIGEFDGPQEFLAVLRDGKLGGGLSSPLVHLISRYAALRRRLGWRPV